MNAVCVLCEFCDHCDHGTSKHSPVSFCVFSRLLTFSSTHPPALWINAVSTFHSGELGVGWRHTLSLHVQHVTSMISQAGLAEIFVNLPLLMLMLILADADVA